MAYIGFDLDETLGRFAVVYYHVTYLSPLKSYYESSEILNKLPPESSEELKQQMESALNLFVKKIAEKEAAGGLGFLRPSILPIAQRLWQLQQEGKVKGVVIYSNNGNLGLLHFAARLIETIAKTPGLFCDFIHWYHPIRRYKREDEEENVLEIDESRPGSGKKTVRTLYNIFMMSPSCKKNAPASFEEFKNNLYFFDDTDHPDISSKIGKRYFQNPIYRYDVPDYEFINNAFIESFSESGLSENNEYETYVQPILGTPGTLANILSAIQQDQASHMKRDYREDNTGFVGRFFSMFPESGPVGAPAPAPVPLPAPAPASYPPLRTVSAPAPKGWKRYIPSWFK
jgi:hypothetical protein